MKRLFYLLLLYTVLGCTFTSPLDTDREAGVAACKRQCREAGAKKATYDTGPFGYERCECWLDGGAARSASEP
jgi:hypothetical protein